MKWCSGGTGTKLKAMRVNYGLILCDVWQSQSCPGCVHIVCIGASKFLGAPPPKNFQKKKRRIPLGNPANSGGNPDLGSGEGGGGSYLL